jgi:hypothetical protein
MWRSGTTRRRRQAVLADMIGAAVRTGEFVQPWHSTPQVWEFFPDESAVLAELQREWRTALAGAVYVAIEAGQGNLPEDVAKAWSQVTQRHRGLRSILEANAEHPAIAAAMAKERSLLSCFDGLLPEPVEAA